MFRKSSLLLSLLVLGGCSSLQAPSGEPVEVVEASQAAPVQVAAAAAPASAETPEPAAQPAAEPAPEWVDAPLSPDTWWEGSVAYKEDEYDIAVPAGKSLEHMFSMMEGDVVVYSWAADMLDPTKLTVEFHGHTIRIGSAPGTVMFYKMHQNNNEKGVLKAPFSGVHGWYLKNESDQDVVVRLKLAGFYSE